MKTLGLLGGIGWESTATYYRLLNEEVRSLRGSLYTAPLLINSLQFQTIDSLARSGRWNDAATELISAAQALERAGAEGLILCSNLMHFVADQLQAAIDIPLLHIGDALLSAAKQRSPHIGLLGTRFTLEHGFLLAQRKTHPRWGLPPIHTPNAADCERLDRIIYDELCRGLIRPSSGAEVLEIGTRLHREGAKTVVLASSELSLLLKPTNTPYWLLDSTEAHASYAVKWMLGEVKTAVDYSRPKFTGEPSLSMAKTPPFQRKKRRPNAAV